MSETAKASVLPIYFVADESTSMEDVVDDLNGGLVELLDAMHLESMAAAKVRLSVVGFSNDARCYLDLADLREISEMPELTASGGTSYAAAFNELRMRLESDVPRLVKEGYRVHRPAVFFLTDGAPTDSNEQAWRGPLGELKGEGFKYRPNIMAFGIGNAKAEVILQVASNPKYAFVSANSRSVGTAVADFCAVLVNSIVSSAQAAANGQTTLQVDEPKGFELAMDHVG